MAANASHSKLRKRKDYLQMRGAHRFVGHYLIVEKRQNSLGMVRFGITVTRRFGKAHQRNRAKRLVREAFRKASIGGSVDVHVRPRSGMERVPYQKIAKELEDLLCK